MHGGQQTGYHRISGISSHLLRARGSNIKVLIISTLPSTAIYNPPRLISFLKVSARAEKSVPLTGATTNFQSSEVVIILLRQSPPRMLCTIGECPSPPKNFGNVQNSWVERGIRLSLDIVYDNDHSGSEDSTDFISCRSGQSGHRPHQPR